MEIIDIIIMGAKFLISSLELTIKIDTFHELGIIENNFTNRTSQTIANKKCFK